MKTLIERSSWGWEQYHFKERVTLLIPESNSEFKNVNTLSFMGFLTLSLIPMGGPLRRAETWNVYSTQAKF